MNRDRVSRIQRDIAAFAQWLYLYPSRTRQSGGGLSRCDSLATVDGRISGLESGPDELRKATHQNIDHWNKNRRLVAVNDLYASL